MFSSPLSDLQSKGSTLRDNADEFLKERTAFLEEQRKVQKLEAALGA
jgi:hypothetical protein